MVVIIYYNYQIVKWEFANTGMHPNSTMLLIFFKKGLLYKYYDNIVYVIKYPRS